MQLRKSLFLLGKNCPQITENGYYDFRPYNYGPFDVAVYHDAERLQAEGYITIQRLPWRSWGEFIITPSGSEKARQLAQEQPAAGVSEYINRLVIWVRSLTFETLVKTIYKHYPDFKENSVFRG